MTKVECENFVERHEISKLIGAPPGYLGHKDPTIIAQDKLDRFLIEKMQNDMHAEEKYQRLHEEIVALYQEIEEATDPEEKKTLEKKYAGALSKFRAYVKAHVERSVQRKTVHSIVLFDEIEKAHPALHNFLLEVTSKGRTRLGNGGEVDFSHSMIVETSNVGSKQITNIAKGKGEIGLMVSRKKEKTDDEIHKSVMKEAKRFFSTEYLNRHSKVVYHLLAPEQLAKIFDTFLNDLFCRLHEQGFDFEVIIDPAVKQLVLRESLDHPENGARLLEDKVRKYLDEPLASLINSGQLSQGNETLYIDVEHEDGEPATIFSVDNGGGRKYLPAPLEILEPEEDKGPPLAQQGGSRSRRVRIE